MVAVNEPVSSTPSRSSVLNPGNVNVNLVDPGPKIFDAVLSAAVGDAVRTFSISAGLLASTVTPGRTAPRYP